MKQLSRVTKFCQRVDYSYDFRREKSECNRKIMVNNRSDYKKILIRRKRNQYDKDKDKTKLEEARFNNATGYWKLLQKSFLQKAK